MPQSPRRLIVLSPHLDDGVLSCGALIAAVPRDCRVEVWTVFCRAPWWGPYSPLAEWLHGTSGGSKGAWLAGRRRREDRAACRVLDSGWRHFFWRDAVYRKAPDGRFLYESGRQDRWLPADDYLVREIAAGLARAPRADDPLAVPFGVGRHVDHLLTRAAAEQCGHNLLGFYPEVPYQARFPDELAGSMAGMVRCGYSPAQTHLAAWLAAVQCYRSQLPMLEEAAGPLPALLSGLATENGLALMLPQGVSPRMVTFLRAVLPDPILAKA